MSLFYDWSSIKSHNSPFLRLLGRALVIPSWLGAVPFALRDRRVVVTPWRMAYSILSASLVFLMSAYAVIFPNPFLSKSNFSMFVFCLQAVVFSFSTFTCLFCVTACRGLINSSIVKLIKVEEILRELNVTPKLRYTRIYSIACMLTVATFSALHILKVRNTNPALLAMFVSLQFGQIYFFCVLELMLFLVDQVRHFLDGVVRRAYPREVTLVRLCTAHDLLADVAANVSKVYGLSALCITLSCFTFLNVNIFIGVKRRGREEPYIFLGWIIIICIPIIRMLNSCGKTTTKGNEFFPILYRFMKKDTSGKLINNVYLSAHLLQKKSFAFNAAGFYNLDFRYFGNILAATVTYSVILMQMGTNF